MSNLLKLEFVVSGDALLLLNEDEGTYKRVSKRHAKIIFGLAGLATTVKPRAVRVRKAKPEVVGGGPAAAEA